MVKSGGVVCYEKNMLACNGYFAIHFGGADSFCKRRFFVGGSLEGASGFRGSAGGGLPGCCSQERKLLLMWRC